jgi:hypothetical protein
MSDKLDRLEGRLESLVGHATAIQADSLGLSAKFGFTAERITQARVQTAEFAEGILATLAGTAPLSTDFAPIIESIKASDIPVEDWREDLESLSGHLRAGAAADVKDIETLRQVLDLLRREVVAFANRIRKR